MALAWLYRQDESDRGPDVRDVARALPDRRKFLQLSIIGNGRRPGQPLGRGQRHRAAAATHVDLRRIDVVVHK
jgi:hypothetical protein